MDSNEGGELSYRAISIWARSSTFLAAKWSQPVNGGRFQQNIRGEHSYRDLPRRHISRSLIPSLRYAIRFIGRTSYPRHCWPNHHEHFPGPGTLPRTWSMCTISYRASKVPQTPIPQSSSQSRPFITYRPPFLAAPRLT